jgi:hypothetical protein
MPKLDINHSALLSASMQIATDEGITDEQEQIDRANTIYEDAKKDTPETPAGQHAKEMADDIIASQKTNEINQPKSFDYEELRNNTSIIAIGEIIKKMGENSAFLAIPTKASPEYQKSCEEAYEKLSMDTFKALNTHKVGMSEYKFVFDSLKSVISALEEQIMQQVIGHRHELMSRYLGTKNPGTQKFDANHATYQDLVDTLEKVRTETGGKLSDYFNMTDSSK